MNVAANSSSAVQPLQDAGTLAALPRRTAVIAGLMAPAIVVTLYLALTHTVPPLQSKVAEESIPATISDNGHYWTSIKMTFSDAEMAILETNDYVYRTYTDGAGPAVDLCIVFSRDNRKGTHPPDVCLAGGGSRIDGRYARTVEVAGDRLNVRELTTTYNGRRTYFAYFYKVGDTFTPDFYRQQALILWYGLTGQNASGALIRYSTPMAEPQDLEKARRRTDELIAATYPSIRSKLNAP